jgi:hypothetical protein
MIKNIFLDAGGVTLDEAEFENNSAMLISQIIKQYNKNYSIKNYWEDVKEAIYRFVPKVYDYILYKNIKDIQEYNILRKGYKNKLKDMNIRFEFMEGIKDFLAEYSKYYKIGILGQYGNDFKNSLKMKTR